MFDLRKVMSDGIGIKFRSSMEVEELLQACQRLGITWTSGTSATQYFPSSSCPYIQLNSWGKMATGDANHVPNESCRELVAWHLVKARMDNIPAFDY